MMALNALLESVINARVSLGTVKGRKVSFPELRQPD